MILIQPEEIRAKRAGLIDRKLKALGVSTATVNIDGPRFDPMVMQELTHIAVVNKTNGYTRLRIGTWDGASFHVLTEETSPTEDTYYFSGDDFLVPPGSRIRAELTGTITGDDLRLVLNGVWVKLKE
uniref:Uncharacterized protein n=1 Tax=viral metagenome TaxID=1070528 RepID=A0A6H2A111_9ZZZZ